jgi:hypothetical protein
VKRGVAPRELLDFAMWCSHCQHEVPVLASPHAPREQRCPRCKRKLASERPPETAPESSADRASSKENAALTLSLAGMPVELDDWELNSDLRATKRILALVKADGMQAVDDSIWDRLPRANKAREPRESPQPRGSRERGSRPTLPAEEKGAPAPKSGLGWLMLSLGLMAFVCGGVLVAWSFVANRPDLWRLGLPITFAGQAGLILGLVLQLDGLWQSSRQAAATLGELDDELAEIKHATTLLSTTHTGPAQSFYAHYSSGASPQLLLADLKGQLDLLATRLDHQNRAA